MAVFTASAWNSKAEYWRGVEDSDWLLPGLLNNPLLGFFAVFSGIRFIERNPAWRPVSGIREHSPKLDNLVRTVILKSPDSTNRSRNDKIHIPALLGFNAGMCYFFPFVL
jgi:hypothetical protein